LIAGAAANEKVVKLSFEYLHFYSPKMAMIFAEKIAKLHHQCLSS